jgi:hypothetical protein
MLRHFAITFSHRKSRLGKHVIRTLNASMGLAIFPAVRPRARAKQNRLLSAWVVHARRMLVAMRDFIAMAGLVRH